MPSFVESLWLAVRQSVYQWNNQRPTASVTISGQDPTTGVITGRIKVVDYEGNSITYLVTTAAEHGSVVVDADGDFTYTPDPAYALTGGPDSFTVTVDDRIGGPHTYGLLGALGIIGPTTTVASLLLAPVLPLNRSPKAGVPPFSYTVDPTTGEVTGTVNVTDPDNDDLTYQLGTSIDPETGSLTMDPETGVWTFTPTQTAREVAAGTAGQDVVSFDVTVRDGKTAVTVSVSTVVAALTYLPGTVKRDPVTGNLAVKAAATTTAYDWVGFDLHAGSSGLSNAEVAGWDNVWIGGSSPDDLTSGAALYPAGSVKIDPVTGDVAMRADRTLLAGDWFVFDPRNGGYYTTTTTVQIWRDVYIAAPPAN